MISAIWRVSCIAHIIYSKRRTVVCHKRKYIIPTAEGIVNNTATITGQAKIAFKL